MNLELLSRLPTQNITLNLTNFIVVEKGEGMDPMDPAFREAVISHSLLKEGGVLALQNLKAKELIFPLRIKGNTSSGVATIIEELHEVLETPGAQCVWQDDGMSQPTFFDVISGQFDVEYAYREAQRHFTLGKLRVFTRPFGHTATPRPFAAASGFGPLLMISPYASGGAVTIGASTQAGVTGFGGKQQPSGGVFYQGAPSLAGDAPAQLQVSYTGPLPNGATNVGCTPFVALSVLPDQFYRPLITSKEVNVFASQRVPTSLVEANAVASTYWSIGGSATGGTGATLQFLPQPIPSSLAYSTGWAGEHRVFAIARASQFARPINTVANALVRTSTTASVIPEDWTLYDLGTFTLRPSSPQLPAFAPLQGGGGTPYALDEAITIYVPPNPGTLDITAFVMLPDTATWYLNPQGVGTVPYGQFKEVTGGGAWIVSPFPNTNTILVDDVLEDQYIYRGASLAGAPSPMGMSASSAHIIPYSRGLPPRPQPYNGAPILAVLGVAQSYVAPVPNVITGGSWVSSQNLKTSVQVNVLERTHYILP